MARPDFNKLWEIAVKEAELAGDSRFKAALLNHESSKEKICRKFGIVSVTDIFRLKPEMQKHTK